MERFVVIYGHGDYECSFTEVVPVEAESKEEIYCKLSEAAISTIAKIRTHGSSALEFELFGHKFNADHLTYHEGAITVDRPGGHLRQGELQFDEVEILTLDEWYARKDS